MNEHEVQRHEVEAGGERVAYLVTGDGAPVVLLHGAGESAEDWRWTLPALARHGRVYALDLPGAGASGKPAADYSPRFFEEAVLSVLRALDVEGATLVGHSLGGLTVLRVALAAPELVGRLVLVGSAGLGRAVNPVLPLVISPGVGEGATALSGTPFGAAQRAWARAALLFARPGRAPAEWIAEQVRLSMRPGFGAATLAALRGQLDARGQREVLTEELGRIHVPALVVWGASDRVFPSSQGEEAARRLPRGEFALVPEAGHLPHVEQPGAFLEAVEPFLAR